MLFVSINFSLEEVAFMNSSCFVICELNCLLPCLLLLTPGFYGTFWCKRKAKKCFNLASD